MPEGIRYVAEPRHVREVTLRGSASASFWSSYLKRETGLSLPPGQPKAQITIIAAAMRWAGVRFSEVSISLAVVHPRSNGGYLLLQAFNSNRVFAWSEHVLFKTPYAHGHSSVCLEPQAEVSLSVGNTLIVQARAFSERRTPLHAGADQWEGTVFLPQFTPGARRFFFARVRGDTTIFPFITADTFSMTPHPGFPVLTALIDSEFQPEQWVIRPDATHGKSKTYSDTALLVRTADCE